MDDEKNVPQKEEIKKNEAKIKAAKGGGKSYILPVSIIVAGLLIAGALFYSNGKPAESQPKAAPAPAAGIQAPTAPPAASAVNIKDVKIAGNPFIGNPNAPVTLAYWFDFQCPFCKRFETTALNQIVDKYVKTGKVKVVFKNFQFLGPDSQTAGLAERAIWETAPSHYFEWQTAMFNAQDGEDRGFGDKKSIIALIKTIPGINADKISQLMDAKKAEYQKENDADKAEGGTFGITGTPGFVIGTHLVVGAMPFSTFDQYIQEGLTAAK